MITNTTSIKLGAVLIINNVVLNFVSSFIFFFMESHRFSHSLYDHIYLSPCACIFPISRARGEAGPEDQLITWRR